jgi:hypothetical protein
MHLFPVAGVHPRIYFPWQVGSPPSDTRGGGAGKKWSKNWGEREVTTLDLERILGRSYLTQLVAKKSDVVEGESVTN